MRVLITGGAGFIGSHLCESFLKRKDDVTILDNLSTGSKANIAHFESKVKLFKGDVRNHELVESLIQKTDLVLHMAAALGVENILQNPIDSISTNYIGSEIVMNAAAKFDKRIVIASTSEIYGKNLKQPLTETDDRVVGTPQKLRWTYSDAKALEEATAHALFLSKKLKVTTVRLFNTVGPRQTGEYGMVVPRFVQAALLNKPLQVYGDGSQSRVFCHVNDTVSAILSLLDNELSIGEVFNIGGTFEISILDLARFIINQINSSSEIKFVKYSEAYSQGFEETFKRIPNIAKINKFTGWAPIESLAKIVSDIVFELNQRNFGHP